MLRVGRVAGVDFLQHPAHHSCNFCGFLKIFPWEKKFKNFKNSAGFQCKILDGSRWLVIINYLTAEDKPARQGSMILPSPKKKHSVNEQCAPGGLFLGGRGGGFQVNIC